MLLGPVLSHGVCFGDKMEGEELCLPPWKKGRIKMCHLLFFFLTVQCHPFIWNVLRLDKMESPVPDICTCSPDNSLHWECVFTQGKLPCCQLSTILQGSNKLWAGKVSTWTHIFYTLQLHPLHFWSMTITPKLWWSFFISGFGSSISWKNLLGGV